MNEGSSELRVGIFVTAALVVGGVFVFAIGNQSAIFASTVSFESRFDTVDGLRPGSPVRIAGIDVGTVEEVDFVLTEEEPGEDGTGGGARAQIRVVMEIREDAAEFIREGSTTSIGSKGLLGDQPIDITVGEGRELAEGTVIPSEQESMLTSFLGDTGEEAEGAVTNVREITEGIRNSISQPEQQADIRGIIHNLEVITRLIHENDGTVRRLLTDPSMADDVQGAIVGLRSTSNELNRTVTSIRRVVGEVERGDGTAHEIIYGDAGVQLLGSLALAASEIATILRDVRTGDNNAHSLLYGDEAGDLIGNLTAASGDLRSIVADVRAGRGTLGGLLVDPSIYEDIKRLVGNLQRNEILRSLVRYSIREDEPRDPPPRPVEGEGPEVVDESDGE